VCVRYLAGGATLRELTQDNGRGGGGYWRKGGGGYERLRGRGGGEREREGGREGEEGEISSAAMPINCTLTAHNVQYTCMSFKTHLSRSLDMTLLDLKTSYEYIQHTDILVECPVPLGLGWVGLGSDSFY
jgi:hypothetical protein